MTATARRSLALPIPPVRQALLATLRQAGFTITAEQLSLVEAERGSRFGGLTLAPDKVPVAVRLDLDPGPGGGSVVVLRLEDRWGLPVARNWGAVSVYRTVFGSLSAQLDRTLARVDPGSASRFEPWEQELGDDVAAMQSAADVAARAHQVVGRHTDRILEGAPDRSKAAASASGVATMEFATADRVVRLDAAVVDAMLTTGQLVVARPGALPDNLVADVQRFVIDLEEHLERAAHVPAALGSTRVELSPTQVPVVGFLFQQSRLREQLPLRLLTVCTTCRLEKVVNPDFARMRERTRRSKALISSVGLVVSGRGGISPYVMLGRMSQVKKSEPDYVCPRCQGLDADERVVTFCPQCGDRRDESVLRVCPNCQHDFRALDPATPDWQEPPEPVAISAAPYAVAAPPPRQPPPQPPLPPPPPPPPTAPAWLADPFGRYDLRYWDGVRWTQHVGRGGVVSTDPPDAPGAPPGY